MARIGVAAMIGALMISGCAGDQASTSSPPQRSTVSVEPTQKPLRPTAPYESDGACPFECCTYREWTVENDTEVFDDFRAPTPATFRVNRGEKITALTGVVVTTQLGVAVATDAIAPNTGMKPDDRFDVLYHVGEGHWKFWFNGQFGEEQIDTPDVCRQRRAPAPPCELEMVTPPQTEWWAHIRTADGREGWARVVGNFGNMDACG